MTLWPNGTPIKPYVSSGFGPRRAPIPGASTYHRGTDFSHTFDLIHAVEPGRVVAINAWPALGYSVWVQHDGFFSKSGHMKNKPAVHFGETLDEGRILGVMGKTGTATDTHLHFEITPGTFHTMNTDQIDPVPFLTARIGGTAAGGGARPVPPQQKEEDDDMIFICETPINGKDATGGVYRWICDPAAGTMRNIDFDEYKFYRDGLKMRELQGLQSPAVTNRYRQTN
ncbi:M23 family metallopeptidase [Microbacterium sp. GCS4]|uniref:M23 family metallopeptidase n=1 Tax=Microbacterium sp. GCS4 TaxID=1692239 RepID=UPI0006807220|nr:M23 family metallopeptidase [Microbacterium sp. GCS4]KNY06871.1 hypothetical protein AKH00_00575 [Microbacterium sp. GCS4]